ncbi:hypothetical protein WA026_019708 [Henosepilachna vigintioctopunctata]|uniref:Reverse transcriptase n=1 Tax=Henosepilachna vigintioctopunctata TaxID=420089 RepID=A0AAW1UQT2_9CUCU
MDGCSRFSDEFIKWCDSNALILNVEKTECIYFNQRRNNKLKLSFSLRESLVSSKNQAKFLGIIVDHELRWSDHIDHVIKKLNSAFYVIYKIKSTVPAYTILQVYYSLVYSCLSYGIILWGNSVDHRRIFVAQKRIIRLMFDLKPRDSCKPVFMAHRILTLSSIYLYKCLVYVKENQTKFPCLTESHNYDTRNSNVLFVPEHDTARYEKSPSYQCIKLFNHLPNEIKNLRGVRFKKIVKEVLLKKAYYNVGEYLLDSNIVK